MPGLTSYFILHTSYFLAVGPVTLGQHVEPLLKEFCYDCHNPKKHKGDLDLETVAASGKLGENREIWEKVVEALESREMPPEKKPQPEVAQRELMVSFLDAELSKADCQQPVNPGRVTIRRLNRAEYHNTIRDLLGVEFNPEDFPNDEVGYGFDNIGDVLSLSPMLMEKYLAAAEQIARKAIVTDLIPRPAVKRLRGESFQSANEWIRPLESHMLGLYREGEGTTEFNFATKGEYVFRVRAYGEQAGTEPPKLALRVGGNLLKEFAVPNSSGKVFEVRAVVEPGARKVAVGYLNNYSNPSHPDPKLRGDRNLFVEYVEIEAPVAAAVELPASHKALIPTMPQPGGELAMAREIFRGFARRAYRRPVTEAELGRLIALVDGVLKNKGTFLEGIQVAVQATLCSTGFLFRLEPDPPAPQTTAARPLSDLEVASRLSYFLWSSMPDAELLNLAERGLLRSDGNLARQTARMLKDWKVQALVENFAGQWLQIRNLNDINIDPQSFPKWKDSLKWQMRRESELFFEAVLREDRDVRDLLDANFSFINENLARFYGIEGISGEKFQRVEFAKDSPRGGVLTQASVLLATSTPTRTSPVIRGKWILEQILGTPPPPPPPDVPPLGEEKAVNRSASLRQRLDAHKAKAECASCHKKMDPLGFALENFDATGAWRESDGKFPIDASGELSGGRRFNGPRELKSQLRKSPLFVQNFTRQLMTYALGRGLDHNDRCAVQEILKRVEPKGYRFSALVEAIVESEGFLERNSVPVSPVPTVSPSPNAFKELPGQGEKRGHSERRASGARPESKNPALGSGDGAVVSVPQPPTRIHQPRRQNLPRGSSTPALVSLAPPLRMTRVLAPLQSGSSAPGQFLKGIAPSPPEP